MEWPAENKLHLHDTKSFRLKVSKVTRIAPQKLQVEALDLSTKRSNDKIGHDSGDQTELNKKSIILEGVWTQNHIIVGTILHLINPQFDEGAKTHTVNNSVGLVVVEPDKLLTCTQVASSLFCERKTWLNHVFLGQVGTNRAMLVGTLVHEVFQHGVRNKIADIDKLTQYLDELLDDATVMLEAYSVELHLSDIRNEAIGYISSVKQWIDKYMFTGPRYPLTNDSDLEVKVISIKDIEENVWSTKYGLKGKIDVTGLVRIHNKKTKTLGDRIIPLELKTGNPNLSASHSAQVSLYSMMIEDRYSETNQGFVIYLKEEAAMHNVALTHNIKRDLVQRRNQIIYNMKSFSRGPDMIDQPRMCKNCERLTECILMSNLYEPEKIDSYYSMKSLEKEAIGHLDDKFTRFFQRYHEKLVSKMSGTGPSEGNSSFWTYSSQAAEAQGTGFGHLLAVTSNKQENSIFITFKRHPKYERTDESSSAVNGNHTGHSAKKRKIDDYFKPIIKTDNSSQILSKPLKPFNTKLNFSRCRMAISLDVDDQSMDSQNSSTAMAIGFINELKEDSFVMKIYEGALDLSKSDLIYRVDKLEKRSQIDIERTVLVRLLAREDWRADRVRQLILDPKFLPIDNIELNLFVLETGFEEISELSDLQQKFVVRAAATDNFYTLNEEVEFDKSNIDKIISVLTRVIRLLNRSVLIVAQTVDNLVDLMRRLQKNNVRFILIDDGKSKQARYQFAGNLVKVAQGNNIELTKKFDSYIRQHEQASVVITSLAMSIGGLVFTRKTFDYCIVYDCDTTELLMSLSPMFCSDRYILIDVKDQKTELQNGSKNVTRTNDNDDVSLGDHLRSLKQMTPVKM